MAKRNNKSAYQKKCEQLQTKARQEVIKLEYELTALKDSITDLEKLNKSAKTRLVNLEKQLSQRDKWIDKLVEYIKMTPEEFKKHILEVEDGAKMAKNLENLMNSLKSLNMFGLEI